MSFCQQSYPYYGYAGYPVYPYTEAGYALGYPAPYQAVPVQFPTNPGPATPQQPSGSRIPGTPGPVVEESYVENILRMNLGKMITLYMTYENNREWNALVFRGRLEAAGRDHIIISDPQTGKRYLLLTVNLDYIVFDEAINYRPPALPPGVR